MREHRHGPIVRKARHKAQPPATDATSRMSNTASARHHGWRQTVSLGNKQSFKAIKRQPDILGTAPKIAQLRG